MKELKKLKKDEEIVLVVNNADNAAREYVAKFGICPPNQVILFKEHRQVFDALAPKCKSLSQEVLGHLIEAGSLEQVMTRCLNEENQLKFVQMYPEKVQEYLSNLEKHLDQNLGAYLTPEAEELYRELCEEDESLPKLQEVFTIKSAGNCPFAGLASLLS